MTRLVEVSVVVLLVLGSVTAAATPSEANPTVATATPGAADDSVPVSPTAPQMDNMSNGSAPPGGFVSSVVGMEEATVDATVTTARFETRFEAARTDAERAAVVARSLNASRSRVRMLEARVERLQARRMNGSISRGWFAVELSWTLSGVESQADVAARLERAARTLPRDALAERNATVADIEALRVRIDRLAATERPDIHRTTFDRPFYRNLAGVVRSLARRNGSPAGGIPGRLLAGERVNLYVEPGMGPPSVVSFRVTGEGRVRDHRAGEHPEATVRLGMDAETARRLARAQDPGRALATAFVAGEVTTTGIGPVARAEWTARGAVLAVFRALVGLAEVVAGVV